MQLALMKRKDMGVVSDELCEGKNIKSLLQDWK